MIVLDASLVIAWLVAERLPSHDTGIYDSLPDYRLVVPAHWPIEVSNALRTRLHSGQLTVSEFADLIVRFDLLTIDVQEPMGTDEILPLAQFAHDHGLTTYDAAYVQLALARQMTLATLDRAMRTAAQRLNIPLLPA